MSGYLVNVCWYLVNISGYLVNVWVFSKCQWVFSKCQWVFSKCQWVLNVHTYQCVYIKQNHVRGGASSPGSTHLYSPPARLISVGRRVGGAWGRGLKGESLLCIATLILSYFHEQTS